MPVQFKKQRLKIPKGKGTKEIPGTFEFDSKVISSQLVIGGFFLNYRKGDHHIDEVEIEFIPVGVTPPNDRAVHILMKCRYHDTDANDTWDGYVDVVVFAEVQGNLLPFGTLFLAPVASQ